MGRQAIGRSPDCSLTSTAPDAAATKLARAAFLMHTSSYAGPLEVGSTQMPNIQPPNAVPPPDAGSIDPIDTPFALLESQAMRWPDRPLLILPSDVAALWRLKQTCWTYRQALAEVRTLAGAYRAAGYGHGHRIALLFENRPQHFFHWLALNHIGAGVVPLNPDCTPDEFSYVLSHSGADLIAAASECRSRVQAAAQRVGVQVCDDGPPPLARSPVRPIEAPAAQIESVLAYTSGTTAKPKGCLLSNRYFLTWGHWYLAQPGHISLRGGLERLITPLPVFHVNAMGNSFFGMLASGGAQVIVDRFHPRSWLDMARETSATCFHYLGVMPAMLLSLPKRADDRRHGLRFGLGGGVRPDQHEAFEARFGVPLLEGWTMTEAGGAALLCAAQEPREVGTRCVGRPDRPGPRFDYRIVADDGTDVQSGVAGELLIRASGADPRRGFFSGYLDDPQATATAWQDGWFHTGDYFVHSETGCLHFAERKKDVIRRSGENISAAEVEAVLALHPQVEQVAVVAANDAAREEEVMAVVVKREGAPPDQPLADELFEHAAATLAYFKVPGHIIFVSQLPTTSTGKLHKASIKALVNGSHADVARFDLRERKQQLSRLRRH